ncbi:TonB-dependent receptor [Sphingorhabdus soli]|uniref:TonB-dependent receptor n=1 Tax=Flavisphingopyxis soli TaxID=2601267 RepID=A0A5C6U890_9SPHN|nr:TonB-dependent receptor [Sphingorhabdus soli]TXC69049.1 TonB-dependent receptor [Sphingorhabdus soli]
MNTRSFPSTLRRFRNHASIGASVLAIALACPAYAQDATDDADQAAAQAAADQDATDATVSADGTEVTQGDAIVVTGSRIRRPNLESTVPVTTVDGAEFFETGRTSVGDTLNELPALRSTFSQSNSTRFLGTAGLNLLDLRGLGTQRTLVLVNGRRHVGGDILSNSVSPDVNTIPTDLIERVDVVTGGNSAIYGSDAIAGVVNFVLKDDFEGLEGRAQAGISKYGDAGSYYTSILAGRNFADGRGNVAINLEYAKQLPFYASDRPAYSQSSGFITVDTDPAGTPNGSDGNPDAVFFQDIRNALYSNGGTFLSYDGGSFYAPYIFQPDGTLVKQTGTRVGRPSVGSFIGGNGDNFRDGKQFGFLPNLDRYSANLVGHFEVSPAFVPFVEAKYSRTDSVSNASGPYFTSAVGERWYTDNPYLTDQAAGIIRDYYGDYYDAAGNSGADGIPDADQNGFVIRRNVVELGNREERAKRETYRAVVGVRGDFNDDWNYEVSANYGEFKERTRIDGNVNLQRMLLAIDAVDQGEATTGVANGNVVCRAQVDPASGSPFDPTNAYSNQTYPGDVASCVPINLFGEGNITQAAKDYVLSNSLARGKITQFVLSGFMSGDTSQFLNLPGGPVGFAIGSEYRRETNYYVQDELTSSGITFYNAIPEFDPKAFEVTEAYGEIRLPILRDLPFFRELTLSAAGRLAKYRGIHKLVKAYNVGLDWSPIEDLRLRGNYSRAVRAPNLAELYTPFGQNYTPPPADPCSDRNLALGTANREANCRADGVPVGYDYIYTSSLPYLSGGNPNLEPETSDSYTFGGVFQPRFLPGFALTVDYYNITVNNVIAGLGAQTILNQCYDSSTIDNQYCDLFDRAGPGGGPNGEIQGQVIENSLRVGPLNYAKLKVRGIDFDLNYRRQIGNLGQLNLRGVYTRVLQNDNFLDPTSPNTPNQILYELGDPRDAFNISTSFKSGAFTLGYKLRYIGKMTPGAIENIKSVGGLPPRNADAFSIDYYPEVFYHDARIAIDPNSKFSFYFGVDNIADKKPPYGLSGAGGGSGIYNNTGRYFYTGVQIKM